MTPVIWILIGVAALVVVVGLALAANKRRALARSAQATELREEAGAQATGVARAEAEARDAQSRADEARAVAQQKSAEAEHLETKAADAAATASERREQRDEALAEADRLDPDVDHKHGETGGSVDRLAEPGPGTTERPTGAPGPQHRAPDATTPDPAPVTSDPAPEGVVPPPPPSEMPPPPEPGPRS